MKFNLYIIKDSDYITYLKNFDSKVPDATAQKQNRPFLGIVLSINSHDYYIPLTSPKQKHLEMKNQVDFIKLDSGKLGALNLNNMIPIMKDAVHRIDINNYPNNSKKDIDYKNLLINQITWCNRNSDTIRKAAQKLYLTITEDKAYVSLKNRCCNFKVLEEKSIMYTKGEKTQTPLLKKHNIFADLERIRQEQEAARKKEPKPPNISPAKPKR